MSAQNKDTVVVVTGPTASGKTRIAVQLARELGDTEIISADSRQVFRGMDIGTGKDRGEYGEVPCHLIDILPPGDRYSAYCFQRDALRSIRSLRGKGAVPLICGGTGYYIYSLLSGRTFPDIGDIGRAEERGDVPLAALCRELYERAPTLYTQTDLHSRRRVLRALRLADRGITEHSRRRHPVPTALLFRTVVDRPVLRGRIRSRLEERLQAGLIEEIKELIGRYGYDTIERYGLEYRYGSRYLRGEMTFDDMREKLTAAIGRFAKRQETYLRYMAKNGLEFIDIRPETVSIPHMALLCRRFFGYSSNMAGEDS